jgi:hypothetical protein
MGIWGKPLSNEGSQSVAYIIVAIVIILILMIISIYAFESIEARAQMILLSVVLIFGITFYISSK